MRREGVRFSGPDLRSELHEPKRPDDRGVEQEHALADAAADLQAFCRTFGRHRLGESPVESQLPQRAADDRSNHQGNDPADNQHGNSRHDIGNVTAHKVGDLRGYACPCLMA